ncbi:MAG TPA: hypothetical protein DD379_21790 [Cyanobacteria bacterium UBA11162]|nr:hypothetical protein [Cyanobacteria bacterium UBA12227]HAX89465.1 hypothetical protein [Cyanobacteria bacterium UBA11370]HBL13973.1 hypothetical protein [Cyanobacteria bacterium UBA11162]HBY80179.1 hypothetical protein [Cyanobacteria bacterium UBA11148]
MQNNKLRNILIGAGVAAVGAIGTKMAVDYFRNRGEEEVVDESQGDAEPTSDAEVAYANVESSSVQSFLDASFGDPGRYVPNRPPKVFDYQGQQYMVIWAYDNQKSKNQMLAFQYTDGGRKMVASVGYTADKTDYNINLESTPFAVEVNGEKITSGHTETGGTNDVDFVLASA